LTLFATEPEPTGALLILGLIAIPVLVAANGFFVAAEFALVAVRKTRVNELVGQGVPRAQAVADAIGHLDRTIASTQLGITLASIALGWVGEATLSYVIEPWFEFLPERQAFLTRHAAATAIAFSLVTFMHVVFGELMPKAVALQTPDKTALWVSPPLNIFSRIASPIISLMNGTGNFLLRRIGFTPSGESAHVHSVEELEMLVEGTEEAGFLDAEQAEFISNVFALSDKRVKDCLVPIEKMLALDVNTPPDKVLETARLGAHTRMPVYEGNLDKIVGIVNTKDLFFLFSTSGVVLLEDALYPATFLDPEETMSNAFKLFRRSHRPMALVRDEHGKVHGLITLEDVLEEIVGDIEDEHDVHVPKLKLKHPAAGRRTVVITAAPKPRPAGS
jgi:putative hemolysin